MNTHTESENLSVLPEEFSSVDSLLNASGISQETRKKLQTLETDSYITGCLARVRQQAGITQEQVAQELGVTQSAISKLECGLDEDLTLKHIATYAKMTKHRVALGFGKPPTHAEAINGCAQEIKSRLQALAKLANQYDEMEKEIASFFGDTVSGILGMLAKCTDGLPNGGRNNPEFAVRMDIEKVNQPKKVSKASSSCVETCA